MSENLLEKNDIFNSLDALKIDQDYSQKVPVKKILTTVPIRKPDKQSFVMVHPDYNIQVGLIEIKQRSETYLVLPSLFDDLYKEIVRYILFLSITRNNDPFLWPVVFPSDNSWHKSLLEAVEQAKTQWVRVITNHSISGYDVLSPLDKLSDPVWPEMSFNDILRKAFDGRIIDTLEHPIVKELRGIM